MTLQVTIDQSDPTPPYGQLRQQLTALIQLGELRANDRLPPVRQLANDLGLAAGTVARAYRDLEKQGLLVTSRGAGTRVAHCKVEAPDEKKEQLLQAATQFARQVRDLNVSDREAIGAVVQSLSNLGR